MSFSIDLGKIKFHFRGEWSQTTTYERDDVVSRKGSSYVCVPKTSINIDPANNIDAQWRKVAQGSDLGTTLVDAGDMLYFDGTNFQKIPAGTAGQSLIMGASGVPEWGASGIVQVVDGHGTTGWSVGNNALNVVPDTTVSLTRKSNNPAFMVYGWFRWDDTNSAASGAGIGVQYSLDGSNWVDFFYPARHEDYMGVGSDMYNVRDRWWFIPASTAPDVAGTTIYFRITHAFNNSNAQSTTAGTAAAPYWNQQIIVQEVSL